MQRMHGRPAPVWVRWPGTRPVLVTLPTYLTVNSSTLLFLHNYHERGAGGGEREKGERWERREGR